jgi:hypothetical protein
VVGEDESPAPDHWGRTGDVVPHLTDQADGGGLGAWAIQARPGAESQVPSRKEPPLEVIHRPMEAQARNTHRREDDGNNDVRRSPAMWVLVAMFVFLLSSVIWSGWQDLSRNSRPVQGAGLIPANHAPVQTASPKTLEIKNIRPGMRVKAFNPEVTDEERAGWQQVDFKNWFELNILLIDEKGKPIYVDLIRPASWVIGLDAQEGKQIWLELEELNGRGWGRVMKLSKARQVEPGEGRVVTGVFSHEVGDLINVHVEGLDKPIGVTQNHPFWSEDQQEFVQAGSLKQGERLRAMVGGSEGGVARVTAITPRGPPGSRETVYNFEVEGEHAYQVSGLGLVVHNTYPTSAGPGIWNPTKFKTAIQSAYDHYVKHVRIRGEFPEIKNVKQYVEAAHAFLKNPIAGSLSKVRTNGEKIFYNPATNTFYSYTANGVPKTMFRPIDKLQYWLKQ